MKSHAAVLSSSYETSTGMPAAVRAQVVNLLSQRLADAIDPDTQTTQGHWSGKGPHSIALLTVFDAIHDALEDYVDLLATFGGRVRRAINETGGWGDQDSGDAHTRISRGVDRVVAVDPELVADHREELVADMVQQRMGSVERTGGK